MNKPSARPHLLFALGAVGAFASLITFAFDRQLGRDWEYFSSLSLFVRSAILQYGVMPVHDPWFCGGLNFLSNPQNRLFSPSLFFDLALPPLWANLAPLVVYAFLGQIGMMRLLEHLGIQRFWGIAGGVLFINANWFGMHYAEGHVAYGTMQLLPWVMLCAFRLHERRAFLALAALLAFFLLDGSIYTFVFAFFLLGTALAIAPRSESARIGHLLRANPGFVALCLVSFALLIAPKVVPVLADLKGRPPQLDLQSISLPLLVRSFFFPFNQVGGSSFATGFHEIGSYIGITSVFVLFFAFLRGRLTWKSDRAWILAALFWLWVATGWLNPVNPWSVFQKLPLFNHVHVQSRTLILFHLILVILLAKAFTRGGRRPALTDPLVLLLLFEALVVRNYSGFVVGKNSRERPLRYETITSQTLAGTIAGDLTYRSPWHYLIQDQGAKECYEPSLRHLANPLRSAGEADYRGEATTEGVGSIRVESLNPRGLEISYADAIPEQTFFRINQRGSRHWTVHQGSARLISATPNERLSLVPGSNSGKLSLRFSPWYLRWIVASWLLGLSLLAGLGWSCRRKSVSG